MHMQMPSLKKLEEMEKDEEEEEVATPVTKALKERLKRKWSNAIIVKPFGKSLSYNHQKFRLERK